MVTDILRVEGLVKEFPVAGTSSVLTAVNGVSFTLAAGETLGVVGESGSGKTTLGRCVLRLQEPTRGTIHFLGQDLRQMSRSDLRRERAQMQIEYQNPGEAFDPTMTIGHLIDEPLRLHSTKSKKERAAEVARLAERVGLAAEPLTQRPRHLSAGDRKRAAIARTIATRPKLVVLDEPTSALDLSVRVQLIDLLIDLQQDFGLSYTFISHDLTTVRQISHRLAIMYLGPILEMEPTEAVFADPQQPYSRALLSSVMVANPWAGKKRLRLAGEIPSPVDLPAGCPLASRCPLVEDICWNTPPRRTSPSARPRGGRPVIPWRRCPRPHGRSGSMPRKPCGPDRIT